MSMHGHFQANYPNRKALTIKEIKEIDWVHLEISDKDDELEEKATV